MIGEPLLKILGLNGKAIHGGTSIWSLPQGEQPGAWMPPIKNLMLCERGYHLVTPFQALKWLIDDSTMWLAEGRGEHLAQDDKSVWAEARLLRQLSWSPQIAALFAADCAERVLPLFEERYPADTRPRDAIQAARAWARGQIDLAVGAAAGAAARAAVWDAARDAARDAAWAAGATAGAAAGDAAGAAWAAAGDAAGDASAAAWRAERDWQTAQLWRYLSGEIS